MTDIVRQIEHTRTTRQMSGTLSIVIYKYDGSTLELASQDGALYYLDIRD